MFSIKNLVALSSVFLASYAMTEEEYFKCRSTNPKVCDYEPPQDIEYLINENGSIHRMIWENRELLPEEYERWDKFLTWLKENNLELPEGYDDYRRNGMRFLQKYKNNFQGGYDEIVEDIKWRETMMAVNLDEDKQLLEMLEYGMVYTYKRDRYMRPITIFNFRKLLDYWTDHPDVTEEKFLLLFEYSAWVVHFELAEPGRIETHVDIGDFSDVGLSEIPVNFLGTMTSAINMHFRTRLGKSYCVNVHWMIRTISQFVYPFLDETTKNKIVIMAEEELVGRQNPVFKTIHRNNLEERFGGKLPNKTDNFWPPQLD